MPRLLALLALVPALAVAQSSYVATNATVYTVDESAPVAEAFAVRDGRFVAVGNAEAVLEAYPEWPRLDLGGRTVVPGLIDAHAHLLGLGEALLSADLVGSTSKADVVARLVAFAEDLPDGAWVTGRGWDQNDWGGDGAFPTRADLDEAFPDRPVWLGRVDGHAGWANTAALRAAGIDPDAPAPADMEGGAVIRDDRGRPTGVFVDAAERLVAGAVPAPDAAFYAEALERALQETARHGLTGVHEAGISLEALALYRAADAQGRLSIRNYAMITPDEIGAFCDAHPDGIEDERLVVRSVKVYADGALGSRGAALLDDYADDAGNHGLLFRQPDALEAHGPRRDGVRAPGQHPRHRRPRQPRRPRRLRVGHRGHRRRPGPPPRSSTPRSCQPRGRPALRRPRRHRLRPADACDQRHALGRRPARRRPLGGRLRLAPSDRRGRAAGAWAATSPSSASRRCSGSTPPSPARTPIRMPAGGWYGNQVLTRAEALRGFTLDAAYAGFMEDEVGSIEVGKRADFVVLSQDLMRRAGRRRS